MGQGELMPHFICNVVILMVYVLGYLERWSLLSWFGQCWHNFMPSTFLITFLGFVLHDASAAAHSKENWIFVFLAVFPPLSYSYEKSFFLDLIDRFDEVRPDLILDIFNQRLFFNELFIICCWYLFIYLLIYFFYFSLKFHCFFPPNSVYHLNFSNSVLMV